MDAASPKAIKAERCGQAFQSKRIMKSLDYLASHSKIQLSGGGQISADQLQVGQLHGAVVALRVEKSISEAPPCW
jgi:hypothetical protein